MSFLHHWNEDEEPSYFEKRDEYLKDLLKDEMASLNEIKNTYNDSDEYSAEEFCKRYNII